MKNFEGRGEKVNEFLIWFRGRKTSALSEWGINHMLSHAAYIEIPLGADKKHDASKEVFSVFSNDKYKNYLK